MKKRIQIGKAKFDRTGFAVAATAILGIREAGKTYLAKGIVEQLIDQKIPVIVFDPIGRWRFLKSPGLGKGYKIVVAGGETPDLPLTPEGSKEIIRAAIRENISVVIDMYDRRLTKSQWRKIVAECFQTLLYENKGVRTIVLEEASEFVPQKINEGQGLAYSEVEKVARMGGNVGLGLILVNQRSQEVNKAVLELCDNLVLMRQRGSNAISSLQKWMDRLDPATASGIAERMPSMTQGECYIWTADTNIPVHTVSGTINSFHPNRRDLKHKASKTRTVDTADFVSRMNKRLPQIVEEQKANDPAQLKNKIKELERQLAHPKVLEKEKVTKVQVLDPKLVSKLDKSVTALDKLFGKIKTDLDEFKDSDALQQIIKSSREIQGLLKVDVIIPGHGGPQIIRQPITRHTATPTAVKPPIGISPEVEDRDKETLFSDGYLKQMPKAMLTALAQHPTGLTKAQILIHSDYRSSGPVSTCFAALERAGLTGNSNGNLVITDRGLNWLGSFDPLPTGEALRRHLMEKEGPMVGSILKVLFESYPNAVGKAEILERTGYKSSGPVSSAFGKIVKLNWAESVGRSLLKASYEFFK